MMSDPPRDASWKAIHHRLVPLMRPDNRTNIGYLLKEYALLGLVLTACGLAHARWSGGGLPGWAYLPIAAVGVFAVGAIQHRFSALAHDASHYALFRNKLANELAGDLLLMFPIFGMTQRFRATHLGHHQYLNDPERDPDIARLNDPVPHRFPMPKGEFVRRYVLAAALWPPATLRYLFGQAKGANSSSGAVSGSLRNVYRFRLGRCLRGAYWLSVLTVVHATGTWALFFLYWVLPALTIFPMLMQLREISHHSNAPGEDRVAGSRIFRVHPFWSACVFPYGQDDHLTHHLFAMLPHYNMKAANRILLEDPRIRDRVVVCRGFFFRTLGTDGPSVLDVLARRPEPGDLIWDGPPRRSDRAEAEAEAPEAATLAPAS
ncbi:fatty acid desaturase family protein [Tautonia plasticadhaerens]|nr:fatty acid desaturase [Tautonia plasticadhaerens]